MQQAGSIEDVRLGPREAEAAVWGHLPAGLRESGTYPIIYLDLSQSPLAWNVEFVSKNESLNTRKPASDSPTTLISFSYAYAFNVDARTGEIISRDPGN
jgi:hypothetical protein